MAGILLPDGLIQLGSNVILFPGGVVQVTSQTTITGTLSATESPDTCSMSGTVVPYAPLQPVQAPVGGGSSRQRRRLRRQPLPLPAQIRGVLYAREAADTCAMRGYITHRAKMAAREAADTCRMAGDIDIYALARRQDEEWLLLA
jgi:hypothetical protein